MDDEGAMLPKTSNTAYSGVNKTESVKKMQRSLGPMVRNSISHPLTQLQLCVATGNLQLTNYLMSIRH